MPMLLSSSNSEGTSLIVAPSSAKATVLFAVGEVGGVTQQLDSSLLLLVKLNVSSLLLSETSSRCSADS